MACVVAPGVLSAETISFFSTLSSASRGAVAGATAAAAEAVAGLEEGEKNCGLAWRLDGCEIGGAKLGRKFLASARNAPPPPPPPPPPSPPPSPHPPVPLS